MKLRRQIATRLPRGNTQNVAKAELKRDWAKKALVQSNGECDHAKIVEYRGKGRCRRVDGSVAGTATRNVDEVKRSRWVIGAPFRCKCGSLGRFPAGDASLTVHRENQTRPVGNTAIQRC